MGYLTVLYIRLGVKFRDLHTKDSYSFRKQLMQKFCSNSLYFFSPTLLNNIDYKLIYILKESLEAAYLTCLKDSKNFLEW